MVSPIFDWSHDGICKQVAGGSGKSCGSVSDEESHVQVRLVADYTIKLEYLKSSFEWLVDKTALIGRISKVPLF